MGNRTVVVRSYRWGVMLFKKEEHEGISGITGLFHSDWKDLCRAIPRQYDYL